MADATVDRKYYASGNKSVINNAFPSERKGRIGQPLVANPTPNPSPSDYNTDKFYRDGGSSASPAKPGRKVDPKGMEHMRPGPGGAYASEPGVVRPLRVSARAEVREAFKRVVELLNSAQAVVVVEVATSQLQSDVELQLDLAVAREVITGERRRDVRFSLMTNTTAELASQLFGKVDDRMAATVPAAKDEADPVPDDMEAFVKGGSDAVTDLVTPEGIAMLQAMDKPIDEAARIALILNTADVDDGDDGDN